MMFIMDVMKFTCSREFTRPELAKFLFCHSYIDQVADNMKVSKKRVSVALSHEICGTLLTNGVVDLNRGVFTPLNAHNFPLSMRFKVFSGPDEFRFRAAMDMGSISDEELFG